MEEDGGDDVREDGRGDRMRGWRRIVEECHAVQCYLT